MPRAFIAPLPSPPLSIPTHLPLLDLLVNIALQLTIRLLQIIIDNRQVMNPRRRRIFELLLSLRQPLLYARFGLSPPATEPAFEFGFRGGCYEDEAGVEVGLLDLFDALVCMSALGARGRTRRES